jgi:exonuclease VII small subunit
MSSMPTKKSEEPKNFKKHLEEIAEILAWFDAQDELDVEKALQKIKAASVLIRESKSHLREIENEFEEIKKEIESGGE